MPNHMSAIRRRHTSEQIITALREAEVGLANGRTVGMVSQELGINARSTPKCWGETSC
jgi:hypothetical protein